MRTLRKVRQFAEDSNGTFSEATLRYQIFRAGENGLEKAKAIVRIGRSVYIDPQAYERWIDAQNAKAAA